MSANSVALKHPKSLRGHLLTLVVVTLLPMLLLGGTLIGWLVMQQRQAIETSTQEIAEALTVAVDRELAANIDALEALARSDTLTSGDLWGFYERSQLAQSQHPYWSNIALIDPSGQQLTNTVRPFGSPLPSVADFDVMRWLLAGNKPVVSDLIQGPVVNRPIVVIMVPVMRDGALRYALSAVVNPQTWSNLLAGFETQSGMIVSLLDGRNRIVARSRDHEELLGREAPPWFVEVRGQAPSGTFRGPTLYGEEVVGAYFPLRMAGWVLSAGMPTAVVLSPLNYTVLVAIGLAVLLLAVSVASATVLARRLAKPVRELAASGGRLAERQPILYSGDVHVREIDDLNRVLAEASAALVEAAKSAENAEARYRSIVDTAVDAIVVIDMAGTVRAFNRAAERTFGYLAEEVIGRNVSMLMPEPDRSAHDGYLAHYLQTGERRVIGIGREVIGQRKDGSVFPLELAIAEWRAAGVTRFTGMVRDITARKAAEEALIAAKEEAEHAMAQALGAAEEARREATRAEKAERAKAQFFAAASHDLRQPVQSLYFFAQVLSDRLKDHPGRDLVASMGQSLDALKLLLDGLLDVSRLDAGVVEPNETDCALGPLLERLVAEYTVQAERQGLRLRLVETSLWTRTDPMLLERVLRNLIENALRYTALGGILIGCRRSGDTVRVQVVDTGIGIADDQQQAVFDEFFQVGNPERDRAKGLGLGLAIVRRLANLLGHRVTVRSRLGAGSAFSVELPCVQPRTLLRNHGGGVANDTGRGLVVIIDDEAIILLSLRTLLEEWGYEVVAAMSGAEALDLLHGIGRMPNLIIADYRLREGRTGVEAIRDIHGVCGVRIPAVVLTGDTAPERLTEIRGAGFRLVHKPITTTLLREILKAAA